jgi:N-acetylglucosaminyl-diphospho-decaprenol L-rhamnosyltransferase
MTTNANALPPPERPKATSGQPTVYVAIVNYKTPELTIDCLRSLVDEIQLYPGSQVVVADNASPDGSGETIAQAIVANGWSAWARLDKMPRNGGFAYGNNAVVQQGREAASPPHYFWLLNSDTIVRQGSLRALVDFMEAHPDAGIAGSRMEDPDGTQQTSAFRFHSIAGEFEGSTGVGPISKLLARWVVPLPPLQKTAPCEWVCGASMFIRAAVFHTAGLLDETYFLYFEETDFCRASRKQGWSCWFVADSRVVHLMGQSSGLTGHHTGTKRRSAYWFESRRHYFIKNHGRHYAIGADLALMCGTLINQIRKFLTGRPSQIPEYFVLDLARNSALLPHARTNRPV